MENVPYLMLLFLFTALAFMIWAARSWAKAQKASDETDPGHKEARMAVERSRTGELISDFVAERDGAAK